MVSFLYRGTYDDFDDNKYANHAGIFALAVKYDIPDLQRLACTQYWRLCQKEWMPLDFLESVLGVYEDTHSSVRELKDCARKCARMHLHDLVAEEISRVRWRDVCLAVPEFAFDVLTCLTQMPTVGECQSCGPHQALEVLQCRCTRCGKGGARPV